MIIIINDNNYNYNNNDNNDDNNDDNSDVVTLNVLLIIKSRET